MNGAIRCMWCRRTGHLIRVPELGEFECGPAERKNCVRIAAGVRNLPLDDRYALVHLAGVVAAMAPRRTARSSR